MVQKPGALKLSTMVPSQYGVRKELKENDATLMKVLTKEFSGLSKKLSTNDIEKRTGLTWVSGRWKTFARTCQEEVEEWSCRCISAPSRSGHRILEFGYQLELSTSITGNSCRMLLSLTSRNPAFRPMKITPISKILVVSTTRKSLEGKTRLAWLFHGFLATTSINGRRCKDAAGEGTGVDVQCRKRNGRCTPACFRILH